jgi:hypothetical protein
MLTRRLTAALVGAVLLALVGCVKEKTQPPEPSEKVRLLTDLGFHDRLLLIAQSYRAFGQVDDQMRWAPAPCAAPQPPKLPELTVSASNDQGTHGRKLYAIFAVFKHEGSYIKPGEPSKVNQTIVKESWLPVEVADDGKTLEPAVRRHTVLDPALACSSDYKGRVVEENYLPYARKDGKLYKAAKQADLFIMYKMDPETPGTDDGWVYGTVTPDGKTVTSAGRVEACMACHVSAPHDRLFGLPKE